MIGKIMQDGTLFPEGVRSDIGSRESVALERELDRLPLGLFALYLHLQKLQIGEANLLINMGKAGIFMSSVFPAGRSLGESIIARSIGG
jgi:hypothetical protein